MFAIEKLELDKIRYVDRCSQAADGEVIQTSSNNQPVIGMRTSYNDPQGGADGIMVMGGQESGHLFADDVADQRAAEDVQAKLLGA